MKAVVAFPAVRGGARLALWAGLLLGLAACALRPVPPEELRLTRIDPNPAGVFETLYAFQGDAVRAADRPVSLAPGVIPPGPSLPPGTARTLRIFHINDLHNHLIAPDTTRGKTNNPLAQMVRHLHTARAAAAPDEIVLFVSAGDDHTGTIFDELLGFKLENFRTSPAYAAYSAAGMDVAALGNHEFDRGSALLRRMLQVARFPVLSANLHGSRRLPVDSYYPAVIGVNQGLRVGLIGLTTPAETLLNHDQDPDLEAAPVLPVLKSLLPKVAAWSDMVIILSHLGCRHLGGRTYAGETRHADAVGDKQVAQAAARLTRKPVLIVGGHSHTELNRDGLNALVDGVPVLQTGAFGQNLGEAVLQLTALADGDWFMDPAAHLIPIKPRNEQVGPDDPDYARYEHDEDLDLAFYRDTMLPLYRQLRDRMREVLGTAGSDPQLDTPATLRDRYTGEAALANFLNDAVVARGRDFPGGAVDLAVFNATGITSGVVPGQPVTFNDWYKVMPYADTLSIVEFSGAQLRDLVQSNALRLVRLEEFQEAGGPLDPNGFISRGFLHFSAGLRYRIVLGPSPGQNQAVDIQVSGRPIEELLQQHFRIAMSSYLIHGNEAWDGSPVRPDLPIPGPGLDLRTLPAQDTGLVYRNETVAYLREHGRVAADTGARKDGRVMVEKQP